MSEPWDISYNKEKLQTLKDVAYRDILTKVYTRHYGMMTLKKYLQSEVRFVLCFVDVDKLKYVNDKYGHVLGDSYIIKVAETLRCFSKNAIISRIGGDEFLILDKYISIDEATGVLKKLLLDLSSYVNEDMSGYKLSFSYGVIEKSVKDSFTVEEILSLVDKEMYVHKGRRARID